MQLLPCAVQAAVTSDKAIAIAAEDTPHTRIEKWSWYMACRNTLRTKEHQNPRRRRRREWRGLVRMWRWWVGEIKQIELVSAEREFESELRAAVH
jgi:hypothetical protein